LREREQAYQIERSFDTANTPPYVTGAAALLLTNVGGFSARVETDIAPGTPKSKPVTGRLLGQGGRLFFAPEGRADASFIWDTSLQAGFVLSESLQAYAPFNANNAVTGITPPDDSGPFSSINGHRCRCSTVVATLRDGTTITINYWHARDLNEFPVRIEVVGGPKPWTANFFEIRKEKFPPSLFQPPDGFGRYYSPAALSTELLARRASMNKKKTFGEDDSGPGGPGTKRPPTDY
jgi:hypothetical protein